MVQSAPRIALDAKFAAVATATGFDYNVARNVKSGGTRLNIFSLTKQFLYPHFQDRDAALDKIKWTWTEVL